MKLSSKLNLILFFLFAITIHSCKKNIPDNLDYQSKKVLSTSDPNYQTRLHEIKELFFKLNIQNKLNPKSENKILWTPDWNHPSTQIVNDSISYVFYRLIAEITFNNKRIKTNQLGSASYLIVKNEREFYRGFYYNPPSKNSASSSNKILIKNFTGNLILSNLVSDQSFLIRYNYGKVIDNFSKERKIASLKLMGNMPLNSYWGRQCHTEIRLCIFGSTGYSYCGGGIDLIFSENCHWPSPQCGVSYSLLDNSEVEVCEDIWFPDPPEPIETGGNEGSGGDDESNTGMMTMPPPPDIPIADMKKFLNCFNRNQPANLIVYAQKTASSFPGHAFITLAQGSNTMTFGFYPKNGFPSNISGPGVMGDDSEHAYNVATNYGNISSNQLNNIIDMFIAYSSTNYNLATNNCANPVLETLNIIGVTSTTGMSMPDAIYSIIQPFATSNNGNAPQTYRNCN